MPVARSAQFHKDYAAVMRVVDRLNLFERNQVQSASGTIFAAGSDMPTSSQRGRPLRRSRRSTAVSGCFPGASQGNFWEAGMFKKARRY
jgi:hypothetical protein